MNTSDGKCAPVVSREKLISAAAPYATQGTHLCFGYRRANTVATEKLIIACPDGKLLPNDPVRLKNVSLYGPATGRSLGRSRLVIAFSTIIRIASFATASPANNAWTLPQERYNAQWVEEKRVGIVLESFKDVVSGAKQMLEPARLAEFRGNVASLNNRAIFEIPEILARLLGAPSDPRTGNDTGVLETCLASPTLCPR